jgi:hypothetical protein
MKYKPNQKNIKIDVSSSKEESKVIQQEAGAAVEEAVEQAQQEEEQKVDFDTWYIVRKHLIPAHHYKEIVRADFKGRKLPKLCTMKEFDSALEKYGVKLA